MSHGSTAWPQVWTPFPSNIHPDAEVIQSRSIAWADEQRLFASREARDKFDRARFGNLVSRCFHLGTTERLQLITDLTTWIFVEDDECDESPLGADVEMLDRRYERFRRYMSGALPFSREPLDLAYHELACRTARLSPSDAWYKRFSQTMSDYFDSSVWEADNRQRRHAPNTEVYRSMRRVTGGLPIYIDLVELALGETLPLAKRRNEVVERMVRITNDVTCYHNDIFSFAKERGAGDVHNLVCSLMLDATMTADEAAAEALRQTDAEVVEFVTLVETLFQNGMIHEAPLDRYVLGLMAIMQGNVDWSYESARYQARREAQAYTPTRSGSHLKAVIAARVAEALASGSPQRK